jgi:hypothetical protein
MSCDLEKNAQHKGAQQNETSWITEFFFSNMSKNQLKVKNFLKLEILPLWFKLKALCKGSYFFLEQCKREQTQPIGTFSNMCPLVCLRRTQVCKCSDFFQYSVIMIFHILKESVVSKGLTFSFYGLNGLK